jgi:hypothetical protein
MKRLFRLGKKRSLFLLCWGGAALCLLFVFAALAIAKAPMRTAPTVAQAQVTIVPPFVGTHSESWEGFPFAALPSGKSILGGIATISGCCMRIEKSFQVCSRTARPTDGTRLMDQDRPQPVVTITFSEPVSAFGAYWASGVGCDQCCGFDDSPSILTFQDVNGNVIGSDTFSYEGDGTLTWHGYTFSTPVKTITRTAQDQQEGFAVDGLQATVASSTPSNSALLSNISTRGFVETGDNVIIGGLIINGSGPKKMLLRVLGPTLGQPPFNIPNAMANPTIDLFNGNTPVASNDNWGDAANHQAISDTGLAPQYALEAAILISLDPGSYTAIVRGANNTPGNALFEAYDLDTTAGSRFANISTRGFVQTGDNVMIAGLIVQGSGSKDVLIRALGPTLGQPPFNVPNSLPDPFLDLRDANGTRILANDNWKSTQQGQIQATGLAPPNDAESAIAITLAPGSYTAIVTGVNNPNGNALVEVYGLN